jgi:hypothetical protein
MRKMINVELIPLMNGPDMPADEQLKKDGEWRKV